MMPITPVLAKLVMISSQPNERSLSAMAGLHVEAGFGMPMQITTPISNFVGKCSNSVNDGIVRGPSWLKSDWMMSWAVS
jgi:hypothetical protein